jgi:hypothetical protein
VATQGQRGKRAAILAHDMILKGEAAQLGAEHHEEGRKNVNT